MRHNDYRIRGRTSKQSQGREKAKLYAHFLPTKKAIN